MGRHLRRILTSLIKGQLWVSLHPSPPFLHLLAKTCEHGLFRDPVSPRTRSPSPIAGWEEGPGRPSQSAASQRVEATPPPSAGTGAGVARSGAASQSPPEKHNNTGLQSPDGTAPPPRRPGRACASWGPLRLAGGRGRGRAGEGRKGGGWARRRPRPPRQRFCACATRQLLVFSTRQLPPSSVRVRRSEVPVWRSQSAAAVELPFVLVPGCGREASVGPFSSLCVKVGGLWYVCGWRGQTRGSLGAGGGESAGPGVVHKAGWGWGALAGREGRRLASMAPGTGTGASSALSGPAGPLPPATRGPYFRDVTPPLPPPFPGTESSGTFLRDKEASCRRPRCPTT